MEQELFSLLNHPISVTPSFSGICIYLVQSLNFSEMFFVFPSKLMFAPHDMILITIYKKKSLFMNCFMISRHDGSYFRFSLLHIYKETVSCCLSKIGKVLSHVYTLMRPSFNSLLNTWNTIYFPVLVHDLRHNNYIERNRRI